MADAADAADADRPSFTRFWKRSKEALGPKKIRFVESNPGGDTGEGSVEGSQDAASEESALDKAKHRRAQVRKAQTQHRQRKANYVKQLEMDVASIREMIEAAERDTRLLLNENMAMRARIQQVLDNNTRPLTLDQGVSLLSEMPQASQLTSDTMFDEVTVTLGFDETMGAASFFLSSPPPPAPPYQQSPGESFAALPDLTPVQTQAAINFILSLEHICRDHFDASFYQPPLPGGMPQPETPLNGHEGHGHSMMASSIALRHAPEHIFQSAARTNRRVPCAASTAFVASLPRSTSREAQTATLAAPPPQVILTPASPEPFSSISASTRTLNASRNPTTATPNPTITTTTKPTDNNPDRDLNISWQTSGLTLRSLYGLARSLTAHNHNTTTTTTTTPTTPTPTNTTANDADNMDVNDNDYGTTFELCLELTPVQAWFELVERFGAAMLMRVGVLEMLKQELAPIIRCPDFGASMERGAFEEVVGRVMVMVGVA